jgi:hypothetical protein
MNKKTIITILFALVAVAGQAQGYHVRSEKIAPLSLSSLRLSPSAPDFRALSRAFSCRFSEVSLNEAKNFASPFI